MGLVSIIVFLCLFLGFITFGLQTVTCTLAKGDVDKFNAKIYNADVVMIRGDVFDITVWDHPAGVNLREVGGLDVSWMFRFR